MRMATFQGVVVADICEARFALSGTIAKVQKRIGDSVKRGEILASLDRKLLQTELDRQLADYEKTRAEFEIFQRKNPGEQSDIEKFTKDARQAALNAAVKDVELAKYRLDQADLASPVNGVIADMSGLAPGLFVTPSGSPISIANKESIRFVFDVHQEQIMQFLSSVHVRVRIHAINKEVDGNTAVPAVGKDGIFPIVCYLDDTNGLVPGMKGEATI